MKNQLFDQIAYNINKGTYTLYMQVLDNQTQVSITHNDFQRFIEMVKMSNSYKIEIEISGNYVYYIPQVK
tara:strand:+ start:156 stop:365 length:210 start_codon:yes stop_codon:yes gene_type:complete